MAYNFITTDSSLFPKIPHNWSLKSGRYCFEENKCKNFDFAEQTLLQFTYGTIVKKKNQEITETDIEIYKKYTKVIPNDIMLNGLNLNYDFISQRIGIVKEKGIITSAYLSLRCHDVFNPMFANYLLKSLDEQKIFHGMGSGVRLTLGFSEFSRIQLPVPPRSEQDQIVRYLDYKTARIDKLISGYKRQIELLEERKLTVIDEAVIHGVDNAELKDSGTNWIRKIPVHWEMVFSKKLFAERKDKAFPDDEQLTASQKYGVITQRDFMEREQRRVTVVMKGEDILKHVGKGDFVISMRSFQGGLEYSYVEGKISSAYVMLIPRKEKVYDEYFKWLLKSRPYIKALQGTADLVRDGQALRYANFAKVSLPIIPLDEQKRIAEYIEAEIAKINRAIPLIQKQITLLQEYRTRLISDVVTGQVDVRDEVIPEMR